MYGSDNADSYGYPGGAAYAAINEVASLTLTPPSQQVTVNKQACGLPRSRIRTARAFRVSR